MANVNIKRGDVVEEIGSDSGCWIVTDVFRNTPGKGKAARIVMPGKPNCVTYVPLEKLRRVGPWR